MEKKIIPIMLNGVQIGEIEDRTTPQPDELSENSFKYQNIVLPKYRDHHITT